jgi:hypothetical protein
LLETLEQRECLKHWKKSGLINGFVYERIEWKRLLQYFTKTIDFMSKVCNYTKTGIWLARYRSWIDLDRSLLILTNTGPGSIQDRYLRYHRQACSWRCCIVWSRICTTPCEEWR